MHEIFFNSLCKGAAYVSIPFYQSNSPFSYCLLFLKENLNPQIRINKIINKCSVNYHPSHSGLTSSVHNLIFQENFSQIFLEFSLKPAFLIMVVGNFQNLWCSDYLENAYMGQKIESRHFYLCPTEFLLQVLISTLPPGRAKFLFPPRQIFFRNSLSPCSKGGYEETHSDI